MNSNYSNITRLIASIVRNCRQLIADTKNTSIVSNGNANGETLHKRQMALGLYLWKKGSYSDSV